MATADTERTVGYLVKRVQQSLRRRCDAALRSTGLSMAQYAALRALAEHPDASAAELARLCFVTRQSLQDLLAGLRSEGLVRSGTSPTRGRATALTLTAAGRKKLAPGDKAVLEVDAAMMDGLPPQAQHQLADWLLHCAERLESEPKT